MTAAADVITRVLDAFPSAAVDLDNLGWYEGLLAGELRLAKCGDCAEFHHPHGPICPRCHSALITWEAVAGAGSIDLATLVYHGPEAAGVDYEAGHPIVSVRLDGAPHVRITASMVDFDPTQIQRGQRVDGVVQPRGGVPTLVFRPVT